MNWFFDIFRNPVAIAGLSSWAFAQLLKTIIHICIYRKLDFKRLFGDGGMPSGHSATVTSVAVMIAIIEGTGSIAFAISGILAIIVCHDATGVRRETEKQAYIINELVKAFSELSEEKLPEVKLKQFVGHTPIQVLAGIILGFCNAFLMAWLFNII